VGFTGMSMNSSGMCFRHFLFATIVARTVKPARARSLALACIGVPAPETCAVVIGGVFL
jgi:hypothetical protein